MGDKGNGFRSASELPAPATTAQIDIPVLRKDKEKKGAGIPLAAAAADSLAVSGALGAMFLVMATDLSEQAKRMGDGAIGRQYGQQAQGNIVERCADKSNEALPQQCEPTAQEIKQEEIDPKKDNTASEDAQAQGAAAYDEGGP